jgi:hypothetical protein
MHGSIEPIDLSRMRTDHWCQRHQRTSAAKSNFTVSSTSFANQYLMKGKFQEISIEKCMAFCP